MAARLEVLDQHLSAPLEEYIVQIVLATREPERYGEDLPACCTTARARARRSRSTAARARMRGSRAATS